MAMKKSKEYIEMHLRKLKTNPEENEKLIKKWERIKRKYEMSIS